MPSKADESMARQIKQINMGAMIALEQGENPTASVAFWDHAHSARELMEQTFGLWPKQGGGYAQTLVEKLGPVVTRSIRQRSSA